MNEIVIFLALGLGVFLLGLLSWIDLKTRLLPNTLVFSFALCGLAVHFATGGAFISYSEMLLGAFIGYGLLFMIRSVSNFYYKVDTLGLGDVKLMGAAGLWLGPDLVLAALIAGSMFSVVFGFTYVLYFRLIKGEKMALMRMQMPAGPGFALGILVCGVYLFG